MGGNIIGIMSPGDMGSAIGKLLSNSGLKVLAYLKDRGELTQLRAKESGIQGVNSYDELVGEASLLISVLVPNEATSIAQTIATSIRRTASHPIYVDCNAIAPRTTENIKHIIEKEGCIFVDAGIIGPPPNEHNSPRIYCSGPDTSKFESLADSGLDIRNIGSQIGQASGMKMLYAATTKGAIALWTEVLAASYALELDDALGQELGDSELLKQMRNHIPTMPRRSKRWVGEMEEIANTLESLGMTPRILLGAADVYTKIGESDLGSLTSRDNNPSLENIFQVLLSPFRTKSL